MLGKKNIFELIDSKKVTSPYNVNQFSIFKIFNIFHKYNFIPTLYRDMATNYSTPYKIKIRGSGNILRQMYVIVGEKTRKNKKNV